MRPATGAALTSLPSSPAGARPFEPLAPLRHDQTELTARARELMAQARFDAVIELTEPIDAAILMPPLAVLRARALIGAGRRQAAIALADAFEARRPAPPPLLDAAGEAAAGLGDWRLALAYLDLALARADEPRLHLRRGLALFNLDRDDDCLAAMTAAARSPELRARALTVMVRLHQRRRRADALAATCEALLADDPHNEFALDHLIRQSIASRDFIAARSWFARARACNPQEFPEALCEFLILERDGRFTAAADLVVRAHARSPLSEDLKRRAAEVLYDIGRLTEAAALAGELEDRDAGRMIDSRVRLAAADDAGDVPDVADDREGRLVKALHAFIGHRFDDCIATLDTVSAKRGDNLAIGNFRDLASTRTLLSHRLFASVRAASAQARPLPLIQQLWVGAALSPIERLSIRSFLACGHEVHLYTYDPRVEAPDGCRIRDAREILPESEIFVHAGTTGRNRGSYAGFADLFRWKLIHERGGAWADCDIICLEPIRSAKIVSTELVRIGHLMLPAVTNCFFAADAGEPALAWAFDHARGIPATDLRWGEIGTHLMARVVAENGWGDRLAAPSDFCPLPTFRMRDAIAGDIDAGAIVETSRCRAVHLYNEGMRDIGVDKNAPFPAHGLIGYLERRVAAREARVRRSDAVA
jgi:tetratricopeptide (TPR) repeat protein